MDAQSIGAYKIVGELGRGAMGVVYQGFDPAIGRPVAIKVIRLNSEMTADDQAQLRQRLIREASAAGKLSHPNIVTVYQLGEDGQDVFIAMEFIKGHSLRQWMSREGGVDQGNCLEILRQAADGLDFAHRAGVVHRDIKPDNLLIREDGCVKIADFGIAKVLESTTHQMTMTGMSIGSPSYMSPEQIRAQQLDARSDQFSLAVVAFEMLTGRKPFAADSLVGLMQQIMTVDPLANAEARQKLPPAMVPVFARALAKNAPERFPTCSEFARALEGRAAAVPQAAAAQAAAAPDVPTATLVSPPTPPTGDTTERARHLNAASDAKRQPVGLIVGIAAAVLVLGGGGYWAAKHKSASASDTAGPAAGAPKESPLVKAVSENHLDEAKNLLAHGADVNSANPDGTTALMVAAEGTPYLPNSMPAFEMLMARNPNLEAEDKSGRTALYRAIADGKYENVDFLLAHKADPNHRAADGTSPLFASVSYGKLPAMKKLFDAGAKIEVADNRGLTPLLQAAEGTPYMPNNLPYVQALIDKGAKIDVQDKQGRTAVFLAATEGKVDAMNLLLDQKADPNQKDNNGTTPLLAAVTYGKMDIIKILLKRGAAVDAADSNGNNPLMQAAEGGPYLPNNGPLVAMLIEAGAKVDAQDSRGRTPLYRASAEGREDAVKVLLDKKADPNQRPSDGTTPLQEAVINGKLDTARILLEHGADPNLADPNGRTPLMLVADGSPYIHNPADFVALLVGKGAKKDAKDSNGKTALDHATDAKNTAVVDRLKNF